MIWIGQFTIGALSKAVLVDSVTEMPIALPLFETVAEAEAFVNWAEAEGVKVRDIPFAAHTLDVLHSLWVKQRRVA